MSGDKWNELRERLRAAANTLEDMAAEPGISVERIRHLYSKQGGVKLALSYMDDQDRSESDHG